MGEKVLTYSANSTLFPKTLAPLVLGTCEPCAVLKTPLAVAPALASS